MTIFDIIKSVLNTKEKIELNCDDESQFSSFMLNRWLSFYSKDLAEYINNTANSHISLLNSKQDQYNYYYYILPKCRFKKIDYVKKVKKEEEESNIMVPEFMSREEYIKNVEFRKQLDI